MPDICPARRQSKRASACQHLPDAFQAPRLFATDLLEHLRQIAIAMKVAAHRIPGWTRRAEEKRLNILEVAHSANSKDREAVPFALVFVLAVSDEPPIEVLR